MDVLSSQHTCGPTFDSKLSSHSSKYNNIIIYLLKDPCKVSFHSLKSSINLSSALPMHCFELSIKLIICCTTATFSILDGSSARHRFQSRVRYIVSMANVASPTHN